MDPLSALTGAVTLAETAGKVIKKLNSLRHRDGAVQQLQNEITDLHALVGSIDATPSGSDPVYLCEKLSLARAIILELEVFIEYDLTKPRDYGNRVNKTKYLLAERRIAVFHEKVRSVKREISLGLSYSLRERIKPMELQLVQISTQNSIVEERTLAIEQNLDRLYSAVSSVVGVRSQSFSNTATPKSEESDKQFQTSAAKSTSLTHMARTDPGPITLTFAQQIGGTRTSSCRCSCHMRKQSYWRSPVLLDRVVGRLMVGYSPSLFNGCDCECRKTRKTTSTFSYTFPSWFAAKAIDFCASFSGNEGPQMFLQVLVIRDDDTMFQAIDAGDVGQCKKLIRSGECSAYDVDYTGEPLLLRALRCMAPNWMEFVHIFLTDCPDNMLAHQDQYGSNALMRCLELNLYQSGNNLYDQMPTNMQLLIRSKVREHVSTYPSLHCLVLGFEDIYESFDEALANTSREEVDERDVHGKTALMWASGLGDKRKVSKLLLKGADPNALDSAGQNSLQVWASLSKDAETLQLLLDAGAELCTPDGDTALHEIFVYHYDDFEPAIGDKLLGNDVPRSLDKLDRNSLVDMCCKCGNILAFRWLIGLEAGMSELRFLNSWTTSNCTFLHTAINQSYSEVEGYSGIVKLLLEFGVDILLQDDAGWTVLHSAAMTANIAIIDILVAHCRTATGLSPLLGKNDNGWTAMDFAVLRAQGCAPSQPAGLDISAEWFAAFLNLWELAGGIVDEVWLRKVLPQDTIETLFGEPTYDTRIESFEDESSDEGEDWHSLDGDQSWNEDKNGMSKT